MVDQVSVPVNPDQNEQWDLRTADYYYLARVETYLMHKYAPELIDQMKVTFHHARMKASGMEVFREEHTVFSDPESLKSQIEADMNRLVQWRPPKKSGRSRPLARPGIGGSYQREFEGL